MKFFCLILLNIVTVSSWTIVDILFPLGSQLSMWQVWTWNKNASFADFKEKEGKFASHIYLFVLLWDIYQIAVSVIICYCKRWFKRNMQHLNLHPLPSYTNSSGYHILQFFQVFYNPRMVSCAKFMTFYHLASVEISFYSSSTLVFIHYFINSLVWAHAISDLD